MLKRSSPARQVVHFRCPIPTQYWAPGVTLDSTLSELQDRTYISDLNVGAQHTRFASPSGSRVFAAGGSSLNTAAPGPFVLVYMSGVLRSRPQDH